MNLRKKLIYLTFIATVSLIMAVVVEYIYFSDFEYRLKTRKFNRVLAEKETIIDNYLNSLIPILNRGENISSAAKDYLSVVIRNQGTVLEYLDDKLAHWSDNSVAVPLTYNDTLFSKRLVFIQNGWFLTKTIKSGNEKIIVLLRLRSDYGFENNLIRKGFIKDFGVPSNTGLSSDINSSDFRVYTKDKRWLFNLVFPPGRKESAFIAIPLILWSLFFTLVLVLVSNLAELISQKGKGLLAVFGALLFLVTIYFIVLIAGIPPILKETEFFSPYRFILNSFIPSLGHFFIIGIMAAVFSSVLYRYFPLGGRSENSETGQIITLTGYFCIAMFFMVILNSIFCNLITESNISFEPYKVLDLSIYSIIGYASVTLIFLVPLVLILKIYSIFRDSIRSLIISFLISTISIIVIVRILNMVNIFVALIFWVTLNVVLWFSFRRKAGKYTITVLLSFVFCLYSLYQILQLSEKKNIEKIKILAVSYSSDNDPDAEQLLLNIWPLFSADTALNSMLKKELTGQDQVDNLYQYLRKSYFGGYWANFNLSVVACRQDSPLSMGSESNIVLNCFSFFNDRIKKDGHQLTGTDFFFLENQGGRACYIGRLFVTLPGNTINGLFIELHSDVDAFEAGYSELLLDRNYKGYAQLKDYNFAKYINGNLVLRTGEFPYDKTDVEYVNKDSDFSIFNKEEFTHVLFKNGNVTVIISKPRVALVDVLISFAYIFAFVLLLSAIILLVLIRSQPKIIFRLNYRKKLQLAFIGILLFSFISVGIVAGYFSIKQYQAKHNENIKEKINSVYAELDRKLSFEKTLNTDWRDETNSSLEELLIKTSNIFNTDINLYSKSGYLIATSRREVFYRDLTSDRLDMDAMINLENLTKSEYIHQEKIGSLEYLSAYVPFYNNENQLLAYLNLPYFRMQSVLAREISNLIVAIINLTVLLIVITVSIAVFISERLTSPLRMLSSGLASVELGKKSEHLNYGGQDEIGDMVRQYNRLVDELEDSARKLANSEREFAWREMAKQVAHEIKNPLTPMKLNIQQLYKSWKDEIPGFDKKLEKFTRSQIEYIDNLSSIASAFSSFAKMPGAQPVEVDLLEQIKTNLELFKNTDRITFRINSPRETKTMVYIDKEHLNGIFSNLIKNGIQSVPTGKDGIIRIGLDIRGDKVIISIADNGAGIPDNLKDNLFTPNFTTKSSGMGLGLSIVKRYVENANGRIWFESEIEKGTVFFVELPLSYTIEKLG